ncbi:hypothetical protein [Agaribacter marinus]|uniref:Uncharacterized protein n=1 Tax=Agaribacter marinus TaxID=1431249 RepID=A0AA37SXZ6_9ALTE|nr:hypothetical protein [Agaribacter marinus]GLR72013.1 hypothetical protein GCM10007852_29210 [Agaribacter marinus]
MNKLINIVLSGLLWRRYKFLIVTLLLLIVSILIVGQIHQDYVEFVQTTKEDTNLAMSFVLKWLSWVVLLVVFGLANHFFNKKKEKIDALDSAGNSALSRVLLWRKDKEINRGLGLKKVSKKAEKMPNENDQRDPFAELREKEKLRSYADFLIQSKDKK